MLDRILIVGLGSIGRRHARIARDLMPQAQIAALRHKSIPSGFQGLVDLCFKTLDEAIAFRPQAAIISNPASLHMNHAIPLAIAGVNLLIEKPISDISDQVQRLIEICRENRCTLMTGYNLRFFSSLRFFRDHIQASRIGRILSVRAEIGQYLPDWRPGTDYRVSVSANAELGGGALLELSHEIDYLRWIFGDVAWVNAVMGTQSDLDINVEDTAFLLMGLKANSNEKEIIVSLNMDFARRDTVRTCTAIGENGTLRWDGIKGSVEIFNLEDSTWRSLYSHAPARDESYLLEWRHFLESISKKTLPLISGEDGLAALRVVEAAKQSSIYHKRVTIPSENHA